MARETDIESEVLFTAIDQYDQLVDELLTLLDQFGGATKYRRHRLNQVRQSIKFKTVLEATAERPLCLESK